MRKSFVAMFAAVACLGALPAKAETLAFSCTVTAPKNGATDTYEIKIDGGKMTFNNARLDYEVAVTPQTVVATKKYPGAANASPVSAVKVTIDRATGKYEQVTSSLTKGTSTVVWAGTCKPL